MKGRTNVFLHCYDHALRALAERRGQLCIRDGVVPKNQKSLTRVFASVIEIAESSIYLLFGVWYGMINVSLAKGDVDFFHTKKSSHPLRFEVAAQKISMVFISSASSSFGKRQFLWRYGGTTIPYHHKTTHTPLLRSITNRFVASFCEVRCASFPLQPSTSLRNTSSTLGINYAILIANP